jgi:hypothetical protein
VSEQSWDDLRLSFHPDAIREHFDEDEDYPEFESATDEQLAEIGSAALSYDYLYEVFHRILVTAAIDTGLVEEEKS